MASNGLTTYDPSIAEHIVERIAAGDTVTQLIKAPGMPSRATFFRWLVKYPELNKVYTAARELSGQAFEEQALNIAQILIDTEETVSSNMIERYKIAMQQFRWSAERRDPKHYGERQQASLIVPVQINTTLNLDEGQVQTKTTESVYHLTAKVIPEVPETLIEVPLDPEPIVPRNKGGRPPANKKHKTPQQLRATINSRAHRKDQTNGTGT